MTQENDLANPEIKTTLRKDEWNKPYGDVHSKGGLTKREYYAGLAMQGIISSMGRELKMETIARDSVLIADMIIKELNKSQTN